MSCKFIDSGICSAEENMACDAFLLDSLSNETKAIVHFYDWKQESATYGHFIEPQDFLSLEGVKKMGLQLAKRPTGGGIVFHNCDLAFSVLIPAVHPSFSTNSLSNYLYINEKVKKAIAAFGNFQLLENENKPQDEASKSFCMAKPTKYDLMMGSRKVGGAAQRKTKAGYLHQGTIFLGMLSEEYLKTVLAPDTMVYEAMRINSFPLLGNKWTKKDLNDGRAQLKSLLLQVFNEEL